MPPTCLHCPAAARYRVTGANYPRAVGACDRHLGAVQKAAGIPRATEAIQDDGVDALFEMPADAKPKGRNLR